MVEGDYISVRVSTFRGDMKIPFNAYVRVAGKYILFCREGDSFEGGRLERIKSKKLQKMYIEKNNSKAYDEYIHLNLEKAYSSSIGKSIDIRAQVIHGALQATTEDLMEDPASQSFYKVAMEGANKFTNFILSEPSSLKAILEIKNLDFSVSHHGVVASALTLAICEELNLHKTRTLELESVTTGSMIHDIEHIYNNINMSVLPEQLTASEKRIYLNHSTDGFKKIVMNNFYAPIIGDLVGKHEEMINGSGPGELREKDIDPFVLALATANQFDHLITYQGIPPKEALKKLLIDRIGQLSLDTMKALQNALKKRQVI